MNADIYNEASSGSGRWSPRYRAEQVVSANDSGSGGSLLSGYFAKDSSAARRSLVAVFIVDGSPFAIRLSHGDGAAFADSYHGLAQVDVVSQLNSVKDAFSLSVTQLAELLGVTRKAVYDWYDGASPRPEKLGRIGLLSEVISSLPPEVDPRKLKNVWGMAVSGASFLDVLNSEASAEELRKGILAKIHELTPRMLASHNIQRKGIDLGEANAIEYERPAAS